jgi:hypothetical protein
LYSPQRRFDSEQGLNIAVIAPPQQPYAYHLIIYRFRPIFAAGARHGLRRPLIKITA